MKKSTNTTHYQGTFFNKRLGLLFFLSVLFFMLQAQEISWTGAVSDDWNTADNWNPVGIPSNSNDVLIKNVGSNPSPILKTGSSTTIHTLLIDEGGHLKIETGATLSVKNINAGFFNIRLLENSQLINEGIINSDGTGEGLRSSNSIVINKGTINLGMDGGLDVFKDGLVIFNGSQFTNDGGTINGGSIGNFVINCQNNMTTFTNKGTIKTGINGQKSKAGISVAFDAIFTHESGSIQIDHTTGMGISVNGTGKFINQANMVIGTINNSIEKRGIQILHTNSLFHHQSGKIEIGQCGQQGLYIFQDGALTIDACAELFVQDQFQAFNPISNNGFIQINANQSHYLGGSTNNGIIEIIQGTLTNPTNNEVIVAPTSQSGCGIVKPALHLGSMPSSTILGIFTNMAATQSAGTFTQGTNTFSHNLGEGVHNLYVKVQNAACGTRVLKWQLTISNCCPPDNIIYVKQNTNGAETGTSWTDAFKTLQPALDLFKSGTCPNVTQIWIAKGTYFPTQDKNGNANPSEPRTKTFFMDFDVKIYGGFTGNEAATFDLNQRDLMNNITYLSGDVGTPNVKTDNIYFIVHTQKVSTAFLMDGVHIVDANHTTSAWGGAWFNDGSSGNAPSSPTVQNCCFANNLSNHGAGMMSLAASGETSPTFTNCAFLNNEVTLNGGAFYVLAFQGKADPVFNNCTFYGNKAMFGSGVRVDASLGTGNPVINNSIFWGGTTPFGSDPVRGQNVSISINHSLLEGTACPASGSTCDANTIFDQDPLFEDAANGNLRLKDCSPAIDAGTNAAFMLAIDKDGKNRKKNATGAASAKIDMGAFEFQGQVTVLQAKCKSIEVQLESNNMKTVQAIEVNDNSTGCPTLSFQINNHNSLTYDCNHVGTPQNVTLKVTDPSGQSSTCPATITVKDDNNPCCAAPDAKCKDHEVILDGNGNATITVNDVNNVSTAECGLQSMTVSPKQFNCSHVGSPVQVTLTVMDVNSNGDNCQADVTVKDTAKPSFNGGCASYPAPFDNDAGQCFAMINFTVPTAVDNCGVQVLEARTRQISPNQGAWSAWSNNPNGQFAPGTWQVRWRATDASGNKKACTKAFTVDDTEPPAAKCKDISVELVNGQTTITPADVNNGSIDNCGIATMDLDVTTFNCTQSGVNFVTLTVEDINGLIGQCDAQVTIKGANLSIADVTKLEGTGNGFNFFLFPITRSNNDCTITADYASADGTATVANNDYQSINGAVYFPAGGSTNQYAIVRVVRDATAEPDENFSINLANVTAGVSITKGQATGIIQNDDTAPIIGDPNAGQILNATNPDIFEGNIHLRSQKEINDFPVDIAVVHGNLIIEGVDVVDLMPLSNLQIVTHRFEIRNTSLSNLAGLTHFNTVGMDLEISSNPFLADLEKLEKIQALDLIHVENNGLEFQTEINPTSMELKIYPNPVQNGTLTLHFPSALETTAQITLLNATGQSVLRQSILDSQTTLKVQHLPAGIYWLKVQTPQGHVTKSVAIFSE